MTAQSGLGFSGIVAIQIPDDGAIGEVLTKLTADNYDYDWAAGGGGGGQVNTVVGGVNITVDAGDPINPIVNLDAAITGVSVNGVTLDATGVATNFLNETGAYSVPPVDTVTADAIYLRLDTTNNPLTGDLEFNTGGDAVIYNSFLDGDIHFDVNNTSGGVNKRAMTITAEDATQGSSAIDLRLSDTCYLSNFIFMQTSLEIVNTESGFASQVTFRLDNAVPATTIRTFGVFTTDPGFGSWTITLGTGAFPNTMSFTGAFDTQFVIASTQVYEFTGGPLVLTDTLFPATANITLSDTSVTGGGFAGGGILSNGTITYDNGFFIWGLMIEQKTYRAAAQPGFAAFTLFNALPLIENAGNFNLVSAITLNVGITHRRNSAGTSTVGQTFGMSFAAQTSATLAGAVMTRTNGLIAVSVAPTYGTVAGSTVNLGTIRGMQFTQPAQALFQPGAGTENMTAYLGIDFPDMTFGGVSRVIEVVRSALNVGTNIRFLNHTGTAESQFGGHVHLNDGIFIKLGGTNAVFDAGIVWDVPTTALALTGGRTSLLGTVKYAPINPATLAAGNNNDWTGLLTDVFTVNTRHWARISGNVVTSVITGIDSTASEDGDTFELTNVSANAIDITHQDVASAAANRIITPTGVTYVLAADETVRVRYDTTTARWRLLGGTGA